ncbi:hypothetical protein FZI91_12895 [Mycobacterium sp. CBMA271]|uniref:Rv1815 family serine proteinase n=1 Tax=unclassified Mycobacteroides TaxID=2618759 RepID=UPI0012DDF773|nr:MULTISPECIES: hypothetical protein [unclassified Mycobacteroides]MUM18629.1 hypothetical protein [Mycobacteroides sp. CBMA 326]MUM22591.1 hypothetical protein [Mycobacteroides sp. CBMA 271]
MAVRLAMAAALVVSTSCFGAATSTRATAEPTAEPLVAYPGMAIVRGHDQCTLSFVDPVTRTGFTAGQCTDVGSVADVRGNLIGEVVLMSRNLSTTEVGAVARDDSVTDYAGIQFGSQVQLANTMPDGTRLRMAQGANPDPGLAVCFMGSVSGQVCGKISALNDGWFTISGAAGHPGDSGAPVYVVTQPGEGLLVGIYSERWGDSAAMSWPAIAAQIPSQLTPQVPAAGPGNGGPELPSPATAPA